MACLAQTRGVASTARPACRRSAVVVRASSEVTSRRAVFGLVAAAAAATMLPQGAQAIKITSQAFTGGLVAGGGNSPKSATAASMEGYTLEGTVKQGISAKKKRTLLASAREDALKVAAKK